MYTSNHNKSNWYFVPPALGGMAGVIIGLVIGNFLGWL